MTPWQRPITAFIDVLNLWAGRIICLAADASDLAMVFEVCSRKLCVLHQTWTLNAPFRGLGPTFGSMISAECWRRPVHGGAGYALMRGVHIRADFPVPQLVAENAGTVDATCIWLLFPAMLFFSGVRPLDHSGWHGFVTGANGQDSTWAPFVAGALAMP